MTKNNDIEEEEFILPSLTKNEKLLAKMVASLMDSDEVAEEYLCCSEDDRSIIAASYFFSTLDHIKRIRAKYAVNEGFKEALRSFIFKELEKVKKYEDGKIQS